MAVTPRALFDLRISGLPGAGYYDISRDAQHFLVNTLVEESSPAPMTVVMNWTAGLEK